MNPYSKELLCGAKKISMPKVGNDLWKMMNHENRGDFMYESPITYHIKEIYDKQMTERENAILVTVSESIGVDVNREELIKALNYDRNQYKKGYANAKGKYESMLDKIRAEIERMPSELTTDGKRMIRQVNVFRIIDKYKAESEVREHGMDESN